MMSIIKGLGLRLMGLIVLGGLVACSSTQKLSYSQMQQRVPLSEEQQTQAQLKMLWLTNSIFKYMHEQLGNVVRSTASPEFEIKIVNIHSKHYRLYLGLHVAALATVVTALPLAPLAPALALNAVIAGSTMVTGGNSLWLHNYFRSDKKHRGLPSWPYRIKITYTAKSRDTSIAEVTGHCTAYFYGFTDSKHISTQPGPITPKEFKYGKRSPMIGFETPFEVDSCTHENIWPETKPGKLRVGSGVDLTDNLLGQANVVANGTLSVTRTQDDLTIKTDITYLSIKADITSHGKKTDDLMIRIKTH